VPPRGDWRRCALTVVGLVLRTDGTVNERGCDFPLPVCVPLPSGLTNVSAISGGGLLNLALKADGTVVQWGASSLSPVPASVQHALAVSAGFSHGLAIVPNVASSLALNGNGYAEAPSGADLNATSWTIEAWFRDDDPNGFNHGNRTILSKGDPASNAEIPYMLQVGHNNIIAGIRTNGHNELHHLGYERAWPRSEGVAPRRRHV
jgi:hypothetical protein